MSLSTQETTLGAFELRERLAGGGMGDVYRARHRHDGTEVAVKIPVVDESKRATREREFRREIQALARLSHPNIATIFDFGTVPDGAEAEEAELTPGAPWLAMEFVEGQPISAEQLDGEWERLREALLALLDALAHAHAYGVLHRDLKPTNLVVEPERSEIRVVDFGIAAVFESRGNLLEVEGEERVRGTPKYMAPEQVLGERGKQGAWTDLYAVGCLAWQLACGSTPFEGSNEEILRGQLNQQPRDFEPNYQVPREFRGWLARMLEKEPHRRPQSAAYAAYRLEHLRSDAADFGGAEEPSSMTSAGPTLSMDEESEFASGATFKSAGRKAESSTESRRTSKSGESISEFSTPGAGFEPWAAPPIPADWRREGQLRVRPLSASGLELFGLRRVPVADRSLERDILWTTLRRVAEADHTSVVLMKGPVGTGKTKLARWLVRRAEELAAGIGIEISNEKEGTAVRGIARGIVRQLGLEGLQGREAVEEGTKRLAQLGVDPEIGEYDIRGILEGAGRIDGSVTDRSKLGFDDVDERHAAYRRVLRVLGRQRPVILWIDDVPRGRLQAQFVRSLFEGSEDDLPRILVVMTATTEAWKSRAEVRTMLEPVLRTPGGLEIDVRPLEAEHQREIISRMLQFEEPIVEALVERTRGRPLFAVQIVADWVEREIVEPGEEGFQLEESLEDAFPESLESLWLRRIDEIVGRYEQRAADQVQRALELAAVLGTRVDSAVWGEVCEVQSVDIPDHLVDEMIEAGLAKRSEEGWEFAHRLLPEAIRQRAAREGRENEHHRACARVLEDRSQMMRLDELEKATGHWESAGHLERALETSAELFERLRNRRWRHWAEDVLEWQLERLEQLNISESDPRYARSRLYRAHLRLEQGQLDESEAEANAVLERARKSGWTELVGRAAMCLQDLSYRRSKAEPALWALELAEEAYVDLEDPEGLGRVLINRATVLNRLRQAYDEGYVQLERGRDLTELSGNDRGVMRCTYESCIRALQENRLDEAQRLAQEVLELSEEIRDRGVHCSALNALGEVERFRGNLEEARDYYLRTYRERRARGAKENEAIALLNLGTTELELGDYRRAEERFRRLLEELTETGFGAQYLAAHIGLLVCAAARNDAEQWDRLFEEIEVALGRDEFRYEDHARMSELAAELAEEAGWMQRAHDGLYLARRIHRQLGDETAIEEIDRRLDQMV